MSGKPVPPKTPTKKRKSKNKKKGKKKKKKNRKTKKNIPLPSSQVQWSVTSSSRELFRFPSSSRAWPTLATKATPCGTGSLGSAQWISRKNGPVLFLSCGPGKRGTLFGAWTILVGQPRKKRGKKGATEQLSFWVGGG